jgi:hypothetical protein
MHSTTRILVDSWDMLCWMFPINRRKCIDVGDNKDEEDTGNVGIGKADGLPVFSLTCVAIPAVLSRLVRWKISSVLGPLRAFQLPVAVSTMAAGELSGAVTVLITCEIRLASVCTRTKGEENGAV